MSSLISKENQEHFISAKISKGVYDLIEACAKEGLIVSPESLFDNVLEEFFKFILNSLEEEVQKALEKTPCRDALLKELFKTALKSKERVSELIDLQAEGKKLELMPRIEYLRIKHQLFVDLIKKNFIPFLFSKKVQRSFVRFIKAIEAEPNRSVKKKEDRMLRKALEKELVSLREKLEKKSKELWTEMKREFITSILLELRHDLLGKKLPRTVGEEVKLTDTAQKHMILAELKGKPLKDLLNKNVLNKVKSELHRPLLERQIREVVKGKKHVVLQNFVGRGEAISPVLSSFLKRDKEKTVNVKVFVGSSYVPLLNSAFKGQNFSEENAGNLVEVAVILYVIKELEFSPGAFKSLRKY